MSITVQIRRGNTAQHSAFTGANAELTYNTDQKVVVAHDGINAGGTYLVSNNQLQANIQYFVNTSQISSNLSNYVTTTNLSNNLANYQTTAGLAANVALLAANSATYLGNSSGTITNIDSWITTNAAAAYTNAVSYTDTKIGTANLAITGNAATAYTNAVSYTDGKILTANSAITGNAATAYTNAVSYTDTKIGTANSAITGNAATAYTNAVSYVDGKSYVNTSQLSNNLSNYALLSGSTFTGNVVANNANTTYDLNVGRNLTVAGNLTITGNVTVIGANTFSIVDNMFYLNSNNTTQNVDLGFAGNYNDGSYHHTGFFRDATDGVWKVFDNYEPEPDAAVNIDTTNTTFRIANFQANVVYVGNTTVYSTVNTTSFSGTSNNSLYLGGTLASGYQTTAGLSANVATLAANSATYLGNSSGTIANVSTWITSNASAAYTNAVSYVDGKSFVNNSQLSTNLSNYVTTTNLTNNLANYQTTAGLNANIAAYLPNYTGIVNATTISTGSVNVINASGLTTTANVNIGAAGELVIAAGAGIFANGGLGSAGEVLHSNGSSIYWATDNEGVTSVATGNGLTGGTITTTGTLSVLANNGITANSTGLFVTPGTGAVVNSTGVHINATYIGTISANNTSFLGGTAAASYQLNSTLAANVAILTANNANNLGGVAAASYVNNSGTYTLSGVITHSGNTVFNNNIIISAGANVYANGALGSAGQALTTNGSSVYWSTIVGTNTAALYTWTNNHTYNANVTIAATGELIISAGAGIYANGSLGTANQVLTSNGSSIYWATAGGGGATLTANSTDTQTFYIPMANTTTGTWSNAVVSTAKLYFVPSSGTLSATIFNSLSDESQKTDINTINNALNIVSGLRGVSFTWKETGKSSTGVIAQEVEKVLPELVTDKDGLKSVNYDGLIGILIESIKELKEEIRVLKQEKYK